MMTLLKAYSEEIGGSVVVASHDIAEAEDYCDRVSVLKEGVLRSAGAPIDLRSEQQHELFLLVLTLNQMQEESLLSQARARIREVVFAFDYVRVEREDRLSLAYNLDARRVDMFALWRKVYDDFFLAGNVDKFSLGRHGLVEVVKYSITQ
jgi:ABC-type multidrug transport system ATPase subunit